MNFIFITDSFECFLPSCQKGVKHFPFVTSSICWQSDINVIFHLEGSLYLVQSEDSWLTGKSWGEAANDFRRDFRILPLNRKAVFSLNKLTVLNALRQELFFLLHHRQVAYAKELPHLWSCLQVFFITIFFFTAGNPDTITLSKSKMNISFLKDGEVKAEYMCCLLHSWADQNPSIEQRLVINIRLDGSIMFKAHLKSFMLNWISWGQAENITLNAL